MGLDMTKAHEPARNPTLGSNALALPRKPNARLTKRITDDLNISPGDPAAPSGSQHFQHGFLGCESPGQMLKISLGIGRAIFLFRSGKNPVKKMLPMLLMQPPNPGDFDKINPMTKNRHESMIGRECAGQKTTTKMRRNQLSPDYIGVQSHFISQICAASAKTESQARDDLVVIRMGANEKPKYHVAPISTNSAIAIVNSDRP
jgi:hypothetical protein